MQASLGLPLFIKSTNILLQNEIACLKKLQLERHQELFFPLICKFTYFISKETGVWTPARELEGSSVSTDSSLDT